jgi:hypothetical protein
MANVNAEKVLFADKILFNDLESAHLENLDLVVSLHSAGKVSSLQFLDRLTEETALRDLVKTSREVATKKQEDAKKQGLTEDSRQFVIEFVRDLQPKVERQIGKKLEPVPIDMSDLAKPMYKNLAGMIKNLDEVSNYRGDHLAAIPRVEVVSLSPRGDQCSGIIIAPNAIATASHCAIYSPTFARIGDSATDGSNEVTIEPSHFQYVPGDLDMAIVIQPDPISGIRPEDFPRFATDAMIASATELTIVGFGGYYADSSEAGIKRLGRVPMLSPDCMKTGEDTQFNCRKGLDMVAGSRELLNRPTCPTAADLDIPNGACGGDSGGAAYVKGADGRLFLAGLISSIDPLKCGCATAANVYVRFDKQIEFLTSLGVKFLPEALAAFNPPVDAAPGGQ